MNIEYCIFALKQYFPKELIYIILHRYCKPPLVHPIYTTLSKGEYILKNVISDVNGEKLRGCYDIAIAANNDIYVSEFINHRISIFSKFGEFKKHFGSYGKGEYKFKSPRGLTFDRDRNLYVVSSGNKLVKKYDFNLNYIIEIDIIKQHDNIRNIIKNDEITYIAICSRNRIYISCMLYVLVFNSKWKYIKCISSEIQLSRSLVINNLGDVYMTNHIINHKQYNIRCYKKFSTTEILASRDNIRGLSVDAHNNIIYSIAQKGVFIHTNGKSHQIIHSPEIFSAITFNSLGELILCSDTELFIYTIK